jgi:Mrp family chromosome partitioning ATPase
MQRENIHQQSLARAVTDLATKGVRKLLVTSAGSGEGKTSVVADLGRTLAASEHASVALVDADAFKPTLHRCFGLGIGPGLGELVEDLYGVDLAAEDPDQFGIGDWLELLRAQSRTGELEVRDAEHTFSLRFMHGELCGIARHGDTESPRLGERLVARGSISTAQRLTALAVQADTGRPLGDVLCTLGVLAPTDLAQVLREQTSERLHTLMRARQARCRFSELAEPWHAAAGGRETAMPQSGRVDELLTDHVRGYLGDPFIASQLSGYLHDTSQPNLKLLPAGNRPSDLIAARQSRPFELLIQRLGRAFEFVLVDVPPASLLTPTASLATVVDGVIMVVRAGRFETSAIQQAIEQLRRAGARIVGVVLTDVNLPGESVLSPYYRTPGAHRGTPMGVLS